MKRILFYITLLFILSVFGYAVAGPAWYSPGTGTTYTGTGADNITTVNLTVSGAANVTGGNVTGITNLGASNAVFTTANITDTLTANVIKTNGTQVLILPNQTNYVGTLFLGNGGSNLDNTGTDAGDYNTFAGIGAGSNTTIAKKNTALGYNALNAATSGWANTGIGYLSLSSGIGTGDLTISGTGVEFYANTAVGEGSMQRATTASYNTCVGVDCLSSMLTGINNTSVGVHGLNKLTDGDGNVGVGRNAGYNITTGNYNVALGFESLFNRTTASNAIGVGYQAGYTDSTSSDQNIYIGCRAGYYQSTGTKNTIIGYEAGKGTSPNRYWYNTFIGQEAGHDVGVEAEGNVAIGYGAGYKLTTGTQNIFIGRDAGNSTSQLGNPTNSIAIGYNTYTNASNQVVLGNSSVTQTILRTPTIQGTSGGYKRKLYEVLSGAMVGGTVTITMGVPTNARLLAVQMKVKDVITSDAGTTWKADFAGGSTTSIGTGLAFAVNTVANVMLAGNEISTAGCNIVLTPNEGNFTAGNIQAIVYTEELTSMLISNP